MGLLSSSSSAGSGKTPPPWSHTSQWVAGCPASGEAQQILVSCGWETPSSWSCLESSHKHQAPSARHRSCLLQALPEAQAWTMANSSRVLHIPKQLRLLSGTDCRDQVPQAQHSSIWKQILTFLKDEIPMWFPDAQSIS